MATAFCPSCDEEIKFAKTPKIGHTLTCPHCGEDLEVIDTNPIELDWAYDDEFEDDYEDYDDDA
jgi:lysine biosynthesis protein LysW